MNKQEVIKFFNQYAPTWDANMVTDDAKMNAIMDAAKISSGKSVLDIACGTGVMFGYYLNRGVAKITGADISPEMVRLCADKFKNNENIAVICADAEEYPFESGYDCCMVFNAFPHFCHPKALIANLFKALKQGGTLTVAHDRGRAALDLHHSGKANPISCGLMSEDDLERIFRSCGFENTYKYATEGIYIVSGEKKRTTD